MAGTVRHAHSSRLVALSTLGRAGAITRERDLAKRGRARRRARRSTRSTEEAPIRCVEAADTIVGMSNSRLVYSAADGARRCRATTATRARRAYERRAMRSRAKDAERRAD